MRAAARRAQFGGVGETAAAPPPWMTLDERLQRTTAVPALARRRVQVYRGAVDAAFAWPAHVHAQQEVDLCMLDADPVSAKL